MLDKGFGIMGLLLAQAWRNELQNGDLNGR